MKHAVTSAFLSSFVLLAACAPAPPPLDLRAPSEAAIRNTIGQWVAAAAAKDAERFASTYATDAVVMLEDVPDLRGAAAIREALSGMMKDPAFVLSFTPDHVEAARSGDLAFETGTWSMTVTGPDGSPSTESGHYVVVWRKDADGVWKAVVDAPVSDAPAVAAKP